jgi:hypothetical protein
LCGEWFGFGLAVWFVARLKERNVLVGNAKMRGWRGEKGLYKVENLLFVFVGVRGN